MKSFKRENLRVKSHLGIAGITGVAVAGAGAGAPADAAHSKAEPRRYSAVDVATGVAGEYGHHPGQSNLGFVRFEASDVDCIDDATQELLRKYARNVQANTNPSCRRIKLTNKRFAPIWARQKPRQLLLSSGWRVEGEHLVLPARVSIEPMVSLLSGNRKRQTHMELHTSMPAAVSAKFQTLLRSGQLLQQQGRVNETEPIYRRALELAIANDADGRRSAVAIKALCSLGHCLSIHGAARHLEAEELLREGIALAHEVLGPEHATGVAAMGYLATLLEGLGNPDEAAQLKRRVVEIRTETLGETDTATLNALNNMGAHVHRQGKFAEAEAMFRKGMRLCAADPNGEHALVFARNLADVLDDTDRMAEAEPLFQRALQGQEETLGLTHEDTIKTAFNFSVMLGKQGRTEEAMTLLHRVQAAMGPAHPMADSIGVKIRMLEQFPSIVTDGMQSLMSSLGPERVQRLRAEVDRLHNQAMREGRGGSLAEDMLAGKGREDLERFFANDLQNSPSVALRSGPSRQAGGASAFAAGDEVELFGLNAAALQEAAAALQAAGGGPDRGAQIFAQKRQGQHGGSVGVRNGGGSTPASPERPDLTEVEATHAQINAQIETLRAQGRSGEAEHVVQEIVSAMTKADGPTHPGTQTWTRKLAELQAERQPGGHHGPARDFGAAVGQLTAMGFEEQKARSMLELTDGNADHALQMLLS